MAAHRSISIAFALSLLAGCAVPTTDSPTSDEELAATDQALVPVRLLDDAKYAQLVRAGLQRFPVNVPKNWTDHDTHDPGVTTLELLSYELTDIAYRSALPMEDLAQPGQPGGATPSVPNNIRICVDIQQRPVWIAAYDEFRGHVRLSKSALVMRSGCFTLRVAPAHSIVYQIAPQERALSYDAARVRLRLFAVR